MTTTTRLLLCLALSTATLSAQQYLISQPISGDTFGARSGGQTFTPGIGVVPPSTAGVLPLTKFTLHYGNLGAQTPSATTFLNIYDDNPNTVGQFWGSSTNSLDTTAAAGLTFGDALVWDFPQLMLVDTIQYWAIMSSTNTAGSVPLEVTLQTADRNGPDVYLGGAGIIGNLAQHPNGVDATFEIEFLNGAPASFATSGTGCPSSVGTANLSAATLPQLGSTLQVDISNVSPIGVPMMVFGLSDTMWSSVPLPLAVSIALPAAPSCMLQVSVDFLQTLTPVGSTASFSLPIPNNPALIGFVLFTQGAQLEATGFSVTEKGIATVGI
ncbi:MAG: hypothetical protein ACI8UD_003517 [Planctomycetota bacterium]|jgi:hypothetical protein